MIAVHFTYLWVFFGGTGLLSAELTLEKIVDFGDLPIFDASAYPCILIGKKTPRTMGSVPSIKISEASMLAHLRESVESSSISLDQSGLSDDV